VTQDAKKKMTNAEFQSYKSRNCIDAVVQANDKEGNYSVCTTRIDVIVHNIKTSTVNG